MKGVIVALLFLSACHHSQKQSETEIAPQIIDTTKAIKIGAYWAAPKSIFKFNSLQDSTGDTLTLVTCAEYGFSPFGKLEDKSEIKNGALKNFSVTDTDVLFFGNPFVCQTLEHNTSRLLLFFDHDPYASRSSYICQGKITDSDVFLIEGVKVGMSKESFIETFFDAFPKELIAKYNFIAFVTCVADITHTYAFKNGKLQSITFNQTEFRR